MKQFHTGLEVDGEVFAEDVTVQEDGDVVVSGTVHSLSLVEQEILFWMGIG